VSQGLIDQLQRNKLLLIETQDAAETTLALANYQKVTHHGGVCDLHITCFDTVGYAVFKCFPLFRPAPEQGNSVKNKTQMWYDGVTDAVCRSQ